MKIHTSPLDKRECCTMKVKRRVVTPLGVAQLSIKKMLADTFNFSLTTEDLVPCSSYEYLEHRTDSMYDCW